MSKIALSVVTAAVVITAGAFASAILFGGPDQPTAMRNVAEAFKVVDFSILPPPQKFSARDDTPLVYRSYRHGTDASKGSVVLVHGSSLPSTSMHAMAKGFAQEGYDVYALDMRGHGGSGERGQIAYIGQLEDDVQDFMKSVSPRGRKSLVGFSDGGGFALRFASDERRALFDNYLLLAPDLGNESTTQRPNRGGWVSTGTVRTSALTWLNHIGLTAFNSFPVTAFALDAKSKELGTASYSFALAANFHPHLDYHADIATADEPMEILVGQEDNQFFPDRFVPEFSTRGKVWPVSLVRSTNHFGLIVTPLAIQTAVEAVHRMNTKPNPLELSASSK